MFRDHLSRIQLLRWFLGFLIIAAVIILSVLIFRFFYSGKAANSKGERIRLPSDVELVLKGFTYNESGTTFRVNISGKEAVLRGKKIMIFRSNLVKSTSLTDLKGSITSKKHNINFQAEEGDWESNKNSPFTLSKNISLLVDGKPVPNVKSVEIYFNRQIVEVKAGNKIIYSY